MKKSVDQISARLAKLMQAKENKLREIYRAIDAEKTSGEKAEKELDAAVSGANYEAIAEASKKKSASRLIVEDLEERAAVIASSPAVDDVSADEIRKDIYEYISGVMDDAASSILPMMEKIVTIANSAEKEKESAMKVLSDLMGDRHDGNGVATLSGDVNIKSSRIGELSIGSRFYNDVERFRHAFR